MRRDIDRVGRRNGHILTILTALTLLMTALVIVPNGAKAQEITIGFEGPEEWMATSYTECHWGFCLTVLGHDHGEVYPVRHIDFWHEDSQDPQSNTYLWVHSLSDVDERFPCRFNMSKQTTGEAVRFRLVSILDVDDGIHRAEKTLTSSWGARYHSQSSGPGQGLFKSEDLMEIDLLADGGWVGIEWFELETGQSYDVNGRVHPPGGHFDNLKVVVLDSLAEERYDEQPPDVTINNFKVVTAINWRNEHEFCKSAPGAVALFLEIWYKDFHRNHSHRMSLMGQDTWCVTIPPPWEHDPPLHGPIEVRILVVLNPPEDSFWEIWNMYVDPSGIVTDAVTGEPVEAATVTLMSCEGPSGGCSVAPLSSYDPTGPGNPQLTTASGGYGWNVVEGYYRVHVEKVGYESVDSRIVQVPPPVLDLDVQLQPIQVDQQCLQDDSTVILVIALLLIIIALLIAIILRRP